MSDSHPLFTMAEDGKAPKHDGEENITLACRPTNALSDVRRWSTDQALHLLSSSSLSEECSFIVKTLAYVDFEKQNWLMLATV